MATGITDATVEEIKARVVLADLISSYGIPVKIAGIAYKACCPFHHEKTPSFNINDTKGFYHCFGCGESGDAIKFVMKYEGLTFVEAVKKLADQCGVKIEEKEDPEAGRRKRLLSLLAELAQFYHRCLLKTKEAELARTYLTERDLGDKIQEDYIIGYAPNGVATILKWGEKYGYSAADLEAAGVIKGPTRPGDLGYHRFGGRLMFSIRDKQGRVVGFSGRQLVASKKSGKYVNSPETAVFKKSNVLYGFDKAAAAITRTPNREVIVCEGQIDCIRLQTSGFPNAVAGQGTAFTEEHVRMLKKAADQVALVYDDDGAGHKATIKSARLCLAAELPVRVVSLPNGDDPDSYLRSHPADDFRLMLDGAESIMSFQVRAERAKEKNPDSVDAVNRMTKELLLTIAQCPGAILRATMLEEVAKLMKLPNAALREELEKVKAAPVPSPVPRAVLGRTAERSETAVGRAGQPAVTAPVAEDSDGTEYDDPDGYEPVDDDPGPLAGEAAAKVLPPPPKEMAFCEFLLANEYSDEAKNLDGLIGEFLPREVFAHDFTWAFVETWRAEIAQGGDLIAPWSDALPPEERAWFDRLLMNQHRTLESSLDVSDIAEEFVRRLWIEHLTRIRGALPATGDAAADLKRMKITLDLKRLNSVKWSSVKELIRDWLQQSQVKVEG